MRATERAIMRLMSGFYVHACLAQVPDIGRQARPMHSIAVQPLSPTRMSHSKAQRLRPLTSMRFRCELGIVTQ